MLRCRAVRGKTYSARGRLLGRIRAELGTETCPTLALPGCCVMVTVCCLPSAPKAGMVLQSCSPAACTVLYFLPFQQQHSLFHRLILLSNSAISRTVSRRKGLSTIRLLIAEEVEGNQQFLCDLHTISMYIRQFCGLFGLSRRENRAERLFLC